MTMQCKMIDSPSEVTLNIVKHDGYVKSNSKYFVTDNLEIFPSSKSLALLQRLNVENMSSLNSIDLRVGTEEVQVLHMTWGLNVLSSYVRDGKSTIAQCSFLAVTWSSISVLFSSLHIHTCSEHHF